MERTEKQTKDIIAREAAYAICTMPKMRSNFLKLAEKYVVECESEPMPSVDTAMYAKRSIIVREEEYKAVLRVLLAAQNRIDSPIHEAVFLRLGEFVVVATNNRLSEENINPEEAVGLDRTQEAFCCPIGPYSEMVRTSNIEREKALPIFEYFLDLDSDPTYLATFRLRGNKRGGFRFFPIKKEKDPDRFKCAQEQRQIELRRTKREKIEDTICAMQVNEGVSRERKPRLSLCWDVLEALKYIQMYPFLVCFADEAEEDEIENGWNAPLNYQNAIRQTAEETKKMLEKKHEISPKDETMPLGDKKVVKIKRFTYKWEVGEDHYPLPATMFSDKQPRDALITPAVLSIKWRQKIRILNTLGIDGWELMKRNKLSTRQLYDVICTAMESIGGVDDWEFEPEDCSDEDAAALLQTLTDAVLDTYLLTLLKLDRDVLLKERNRTGKPSGSQSKANDKRKKEFQKMVAENKRLKDAIKESEAKAKEEIRKETKRFKDEAVDERTETAKAKKENRELREELEQARKQLAEYGQLLDEMSEAQNEAESDENDFSEQDFKDFIKTHRIAVWGARDDRKELYKEKFPELVFIDSNRTGSYTPASIRQFDGTIIFTAWTSHSSFWAYRDSVKRAGIPKVQLEKSANSDRHLVIAGRQLLRKLEQNAEQKQKGI